MGYIKHHAIVVTSELRDSIERAHAKAVECCCGVTPITDGAGYGSLSFLIPPDGSKEGWPASDTGDAARAEFMRWADEQRYDDGSTALAWVEVAYSPDDRKASITRHAWVVLRSLMGTR